MKFFCPYCSNEKPNGYEPAAWDCCGEVGHAVACNCDDTEGRCTADDGDMCALCVAEWQEEYRAMHAQWKALTLAERDPEAYRQSMIDAGRGHLVKGDHNAR